MRPRRAASPPPPTLVPPEEPRFLTSALYGSAALAVVLLLTAVAACAVHGTAGAHILGLQLVSAACSPGGVGMARAMAMATSCEQTAAQLGNTQPMFAPWHLLVLATALLYLTVILAESAAFHAALAIAGRAARGALSLIDPAIMRRRARAYV